MEACHWPHQLPHQCFGPIVESEWYLDPRLLSCSLQGRAEEAGEGPSYEHTVSQLPTV